ncbi:serine hydrolase [Streptomyces cadmiisoli]|uniref:Beta-lactamase class A catalytic domain-containing protein n=1 Tax=Streptomyces cadmiisoli TaxID=2184053 RepID=A0A2Z4JDY2_9ACTN|nr:serine hydrolase [Streptomyces cadmiisoli]AWW43352.1 hypothetical protein DN051_43060 [Streptomyces cadmiisoli]
MMRNRIPRRALAVAAAAGAVTSVGAGQVYAAPSAPSAPRVSCVSAKAGLAAELQRDITAALDRQDATTAVSLRDRTTGTLCTLRPDQRFDSASTVKVTVLAALLRDVHQQGRHLTDREARLAREMITESDNNATAALWKQLGRAKVEAFLAAAGMNETVLGEGRFWGLTQITARDEQKLMDLVSTRNRVLSDAARGHILKLMSEVVPEQRWGTPAGAPASATVHVKNGWLSRTEHGWRVHSLGVFTGGKHDYSLTVLTEDASTMKAGIKVVEAVARAVHGDLAAAV